MIIGLSGGDIYLGIVLLKDTLQALSSSKGSQKQYDQAVQQLETLEICLKVAQSRLTALEEDDARNIIARAVSECARCIENYQYQIIRKYEKFFGAEQPNARRKLLKELKKIQWLHEKTKTEAFSKAIASYIQIITLACSIGALYVFLKSRNISVCLHFLSPRHKDLNRGHSKPSTQLSTILELEGDDLAPKWGAGSARPSFSTESPESLDTSLKGKERESSDDHQSLLSRRSTMEAVSDLLKPEASTTSPSESSPIIPIRQEQYYPEALFKSTSSVFSRRTTDTPSLFSHASEATSLTSPSIATTATLPNQWVDDRGVCHNPRCSQRSFFQKKAFKLYTHLTHSNSSVSSSGSGRQGASPVKATCEHALLHLQAMESSVSLGRTSLR